MKMKTLGRFLTVVMVGVFASALAFGQNNILSGRDFGHTRSVKTARTKVLQQQADSISNANLNNYYIGYDFVMSRKLIGEDDLSKCLARLAILWDELEGQPEAAQIETLMRMVVRGNGSVQERVAKLNAAQVAIELRYKGEQKWYYNVGKAYTKLSLDLNAKDGDAVQARMLELGKLGKSAPATVPPAFTAALVKIGDYGAKSSFTDNDVQAITSQFDTIDKIIGA
jgi:hypothetical protein